LDSYNTGAQSERFPSPLRRGATIDLSPEDGERYKIGEGEKVRVSFAARIRGCASAVRSGIAAGLAFLSVHFHEQVATNDLTN